MKTCVIAEYACFGAAGNIAAALNCPAIFFQRDPKNFDAGLNYKIGLQNIPPDCDQWIIVATQAFSLMMQSAIKIPEQVKIILVDSNYLAKPDYWNLKFEKLRETTNLQLYAMPDLLPLTPSGTLPYYQPFEINIPVNKSETLTVCHSPWHKVYGNLKGTKEIQTALSGIEIPHTFDCITDSTWQQTIERKAKAHIFIDQIIDRNGYTGGLGKSGLEAMLLKCLVITSGEPLTTEQIPAPPVIRTNKDRLKNVLIKYMLNTAEREKQIEKQYQWAKKYLSYDFIRNYLQ